MIVSHAKLADMHCVRVYNYRDQQLSPAHGPTLEVSYYGKA